MENIYRRNERGHHFRSPADNLTCVLLIKLVAGLRLILGLRVDIIRRELCNSEGRCTNLRVDGLMVFLCVPRNWNPRSIRCFLDLNLQKTDRLQS
jgi:hypothetical protein